MTDKMEVDTSINDYRGKKDKYRKEIGQRIHQVRKSLGFTQEQMVAYLPIGRANYSRIEKGEVFPNPIFLQVFYSEFNISMEWLLCNEGAMSRQKELKKVMGITESTDEIKDLLIHLEKVPMVRHALLRFFLEYKAINQKFITAQFPLEEVEPGVLE
ncbi:MAG: helix-turn-helix domain-containing protein [bacterium]|nr:helix-turn-helix domain-containing protein [bacterium]